jgi:hypothetical protein
MNTIQINNATVTKTTSGIFTAIIDGDWFNASELAQKIQKVAGLKPIRIYEIMPGVQGIEVG